jgi:nitrogen fixation protein FixH
MKLNWGHKLTFVFIVFVGLMATLIYKSMNTNFDLVTKEYYKDELAYQKVIDGTNNANQLSAKPSITKENEQVIVSFPNETVTSAISGTMWFYCPSDASKDMRLPLNLIEGKQAIQLAELRPGKYTVKINWEQDNKPFYSEQTLFID